ncbi:hypothetical protein [Seleniivibrio woodruffii]|uniref:Tetratricopeptide repeat-like domain-containing protein n=1 Tax=Seleniivibrio woodruffii TaxID=1078050 RepID=A0A4R1K8Z0_9BACT|nr:hypothetical protein [Seleniivibrio woodruffii]TCK60822.1 hypothetical protein C8D98_1701 [Seleniivibrio woodruffii]TVZ36452.1 hypothetical protein OF66_2077 [Seleniivibrio woodruffii]
MSKRKPVIDIEEEPIDKVEHFLAKNLKKMIIGLAGVFVLFIIGYTFTKLDNSKDSMLVNKVGMLELTAMMNNYETAKVADYNKSAAEFKDAASYINLRSAQMYVLSNNAKDAAEPLSKAGGEMKELADSLKADTEGKIDAKAYIASGKLTSVWYYRACLDATGAEKQKLMKDFETAYPKSELLKQLKRWNG